MTVQSSGMAFGKTGVLGGEVTGSQFWSHHVPALAPRRAPRLEGCAGADPSLPPLQACRDFLDLAETHSRKWQRALQYEREQRIRLEETIEQLAKQHNSLERACRGAPGLSSSTTGITSTTKGECRGRALREAWDGWGGGSARLVPASCHGCEGCKEQCPACSW